jgi:hypothetical protein
MMLLINKGSDLSGRLFPVRLGQLNLRGKPGWVAGLRIVDFAMGIPRWQGTALSVVGRLLVEMETPQPV